MNFSKLLIANRGEIACRVIDSARALGYASVALFSDADADARHVALADEAVHIGPAPAADSYLRVDRILEAAARCGADAIHPGYGFLAENADFAQACADANIVFVGPSPEAIRAMGDKALAKARMIAAGVPCVPGFLSERPEDQRDEVLIREAANVGFPLLVKAVAGGGGRGMRRVDAPAELAAALESARGESAAAFGNGDLMLERLVTGARHVEVQVFADEHGNVVHLGERDCSLQRRHQKVVEESPSPAVDADLRARMGEAAVKAARAIDYTGAGTVEFLLDAAGEFFFLEMNTRLQVEHPVTELVTDLDLVELQLRVAAGKPLGFEQDDVHLDGHAFEARLYAEDPYAGFLPQTGPILAWQPSEGQGRRNDHGIREGQSITAHYDAMVAKVIVWGRDREEALRRLQAALRDTVLLGVGHNKRFLLDTLAHVDFAAGAITTNWLDERLPLERPARSLAAAAIAATLLSESAPGPAGPAWSNSGVARSHLRLQVGDEIVEASLETSHAPEGGHRLQVGVQVGDQPAQALRLLETVGPRAQVEVDGHRFEVHAALNRQGELALEVDGIFESWRVAPPQGKASAVAGSDGRIHAPSSGKVLSVAVEPGQRVARGELLLKLEAMKIESSLLSPVEGVVTEVRASPDDQVQQRALLILIDVAASDAT